MATETKLKVVIDAQDRASNKVRGLTGSLKKLKGGLGVLKTSLIGVTAGVTGLGFAAKKLIDTFGVQERAEARLAAGIKNVNEQWAKSEDGMKQLTDQGWDLADVIQADTDELKAYARQLQKATTFGDEAIISSMALSSNTIFTSSFSPKEASSRLT